MTATEVESRQRLVVLSTAVLGGVALLLSTLAAAVIVPGLPYDEPAHWSNVEYFRDHRSLPVLGDPGVGYQGQQTPLFYFMAALVASPFGAGGFAAARGLSVVGFAILVMLTAAILARVAPRNLPVIVGGTAFIAVNPMLIVMSATVQNDTWALVWGFGAILLVLMPYPGPRWVHGALVGVAASLAILTKLSMAPLLIGVVIAYLIRRRLVEAVSACVVAALATGWWFVRNLVLYGDLTGQSAVERTGAIFENVATTPFALARTVLTYLTLPTEYVRNEIAAPLWVDASAVLVGAILVTGLVLLAAREWRGYSRPGTLLLVLVGSAAVVAWLIQVLFGWPVAFRTAYAVLPLIALAAGTATAVGRSAWTRWGVVALMGALQLAIGVWVAIALTQLDRPSLLW